MVNERKKSNDIVCISQNLTMGEFWLVLMWLQIKYYIPTALWMVILSIVHTAKHMTKQNWYEWI